MEGQQRAALFGALAVLVFALGTLVFDDESSGDWTRRVSVSERAGGDLDADGVGAAIAGGPADASTSSTAAVDATATTVGGAATTTTAGSGGGGGGEGAGGGDDEEEQDEAPRPTAPPTTAALRLPITTTTTVAVTVPNSPPPATGVVRRTDYEATLLQKHNDERAAAGLPALSRSGCLDSVAVAWTRSQAERDQWGHNPSYFEQIQGCMNPSAVAENVAWSEVSISAVFSWWMGSSAHRTNILSPDYAYIGIGVYESATGTIYATVNFAR